MSASESKLKSKWLHFWETAINCFRLDKNPPRNKSKIGQIRKTLRKSTASKLEKQIKETESEEEVKYIQNVHAENTESCFDDHEHDNIKNGNQGSAKSSLASLNNNTKMSLVSRFSKASNASNSILEKIKPSMASKKASLAKFRDSHKNMQKAQGPNLRRQSSNLSKASQITRTSQKEKPTSARRCSKQSKTRLSRLSTMSNSKVSLHRMSRSSTKSNKGKELSLEDSSNILPSSISGNDRDMSGRSLELKDSMHSVILLNSGVELHNMAPLAEEEYNEDGQIDETKTNTTNNPLMGAQDTNTVVFRHIDGVYKDNVKKVHKNNNNSEDGREDNLSYQNSNQYAFEHQSILTYDSSNTSSGSGDEGDIDSCESDSSEGLHASYLVCT